MMGVLGVAFDRVNLRSRRVSQAFIVALLAVLLSGCRVGEPQRTMCALIQSNANAPVVEKAKCWLGQISWWLAEMPAVGEAVIAPLLAQLPSNQHWLLGAAIVVVVLLCCCSAGSGN